jgi:glycerol uptake facilitator-like aquaporin
MARLELPNNLRLAEKVLEYETQRTTRSSEMGWIGRIFGNAIEKPGNIAGTAIVVSFLVLMGVIFASWHDPSFKTDALIPVFTGIITLALGYLFGKGSGGHS